MEKNANIYHIQAQVQSIIDKGPSEERLRRISKAIKETFGFDIDITIVKNTSKDFFGATICPEVTTMNKIVDAILLDKSETETIVSLWQTSDKWMMELDSLLFDRGFREKLTADEITAVILHEIGHIVYSSSVPVRLNNIIRYRVAKMNYTTKELIRSDKLKQLFTLVIIDACGVKSFSKTDGLRTEKIADAFAIKYGYGDALNSFIDKLLISYGNSAVDRSEVDMNKETEVLVNWTVNNVEMLKSRKDALKNALKIEMFKNPSDIVKAVASSIYNNFFGAKTDKFRAIMLEQAGIEEDVVGEAEAMDVLDEEYDRVVKESIFLFISNMGKIKPVNRRDIDMIRLDIDAIETHNDKLYLLDTIYAMIDQCNVALDHIEMGKENKVTQSKSTLTAMRDELLSLKDDVLATRIIEKDTGVFIKYPKGYQG